MRTHPCELPWADCQGQEAKTKLVKGLAYCWNWQKFSMSRAQTEKGVIAVGGKRNLRAV